MEAHRTGRVIVGVSTSLAGYQALRFAVAEARRRGAEVVAVRAFSYSYFGGASQFQGVAYDAARAVVTNALVEALGGPPRDVPIRVEIREGVAGRVLSALADRPDDVIVIGGSAGRRGFGRRGGLVARDCARRADCQIVVVPPPEMARGGSQVHLARLAAQEAESFVWQGR